jgi:DtxR family Mn-dependent transcriptional regulator
MPSESVENYLKAIYRLSGKKGELVSTNAIADRLETKASSVTDMLKKLSERNLLTYTPYKGALLTESGEQTALQIIRKHRLWEVFLLEKLNFNWDEVHAMAEELEHIDSEELVNRLDDFLGNPKFDPHGDPIPDRNGNIRSHEDLSMADLKENNEGVIVGLKETSTDFLKMLENKGLTIGVKVTLKERNEWDRSIQIDTVNGRVELSVDAARNIYVTN